MTDSINILLNGDNRVIEGNLSLRGLLESLALDERTVVVELNREIIRKNHLAETAVKSGDQVELVHFVGGG
jgi:sulfur carrier protein